eukprot:3293396-Rhodomonas_salina.1
MAVVKSSQFCWVNFWHFSAPGWNAKPSSRKMCGLTPSKQPCEKLLERVSLFGVHVQNRASSAGFRLDSLLDEC